MQHDRPLLFIDVEATGLSISEDRVIQIGTAELQPGSGALSGFRMTLVNPGRPIPEVVTKLTRLTDEDVATAEPFREIARKLADYIAGFDLVGFNLLNFDVPILAEEFLRCEVEPPFERVGIIDCGVIFKRKEERTLGAAVQFYCGMEAKDLHDALQDATHTAHVLQGQIDRYGFKTFQEAALASRYPEDKRIDFAGKLSRNDAGEPIYTFGQRTKGVRVCDDLGFAEWMLNRDFPLDTKRKLRAILDEIEANAKRADDSGLIF